MTLPARGDRPTVKIYTKDDPLLAAINVCEEPKHRFIISIFVGLAIGGVFAILDAIDALVVSDWLGDKAVSVGAAKTISGLIQLAFIFCALTFCMVCFTWEVVKR